MPSLVQDKNGKWKVGLQIKSTNVPSNLVIPTTLVYQGSTENVDATVKNVTQKTTDWQTPVGEPIVTDAIAWSAEPVSVDDTLYKVNSITWTQQPFDEESHTRYVVVITPASTTISCTGSTTCTVEYQKLIDDEIETRTTIPSSDTGLTWESLNTDVATVSGGTIVGTNGTPLDKNVTIRATYSGITGSVVITVSGNGESGGGGGGGTAEPTGIRLDTTSVALTTYGTLAKTIYSTVSPSNARQDVIWESSDRTVCTVTKGKKINSGFIEVAKNAKVGTCVITVYTYDRKYSATCTVTVTAEGTFVTAVTPTVINAGEFQESHHVVVSTENIGKDSGFGFYGGSNSIDGVRYVRTSEFEGDLVIPQNYGNARTGKARFHGNFSTDGGVEIVINQEGSTIVKGFKYWDEGYYDATGKHYFLEDEKGRVICSYASVLHFVCAVDGRQQAIANADCDSWIHLNTAKSGWEDHTAAQLEEYERYGTIGGKDPGFNGRTGVFWINTLVDANTTGHDRDGYITFPGNATFTIHQLG